MRTSLVSFDELLKYSSLDFGVPMPKTAKSKITRKLEALKEKLPINSSIDLSFNQQGQKFKGYLKIKTLTNTFSSVYFGVSLISTYKQLEYEVEKQILNWKQSRFQKNLFKIKAGFNNYYKRGI